MLPKTMYESLPALYLLSAVFSIYLLDSAIVIASAILLIASAVLVSYMRWSYRRGNIPSKGI
jgi:intracellular septation protein A